MDGIPKIHVKHSHIEINNYDIGDVPRLEYLFSVYDPIRHASFPKCIEYNLKTKKLYLPRGMDIAALSSLFMYEPYIDKDPDPYVDSDPIPIKYMPRDERQIEILKFILGEGKYYYTKSKSQLSVNSTTGSGKTFTTVATMCYTGARMIIITSSTNWLEQWKNKILEYTNLTEKNIFNIIGAASIQKILNRNPLDYQVFLVSHSSIRSYSDKYGWENVEVLFKHLKCSFKVYDEAHLYIDNMAKIDFHSNTKKTLYLTATPERSDKEEDIIFQEYFKTVPSIDLFDEDKDPHVNYISMLYKSHPSHQDVINYSKGKFNFDRNIYTGYLINRPNFKKLLTILIDATLWMPGKVLIYIGTNDAIAKVYEFIMYKFPFLAGHVSIYTSITDPKEKEDALKKKFILSTTKSCGAASDIYDLGCTIVLAEPFKSPVIARQSLGRCRKDNTYYIDCTDISCNRFKQYYKDKKPIFLKYAKSTKELFLDDDELDNRYKAVTEKYENRRVMFLPVWKE